MDERKLLVDEGYDDGYHGRPKKDPEDIESIGMRAIEEYEAYLLGYSEGEVCRSLEMWAERQP